MAQYNRPETRRAAAARAAKLMKLFSSPHFENIMTAVDPPAGGGLQDDNNEFTTACQNAGLVQVEIEWLKTYLSQCKKALYDPLPDAALSGW